MGSIVSITTESVMRDYTQFDSNVFSCTVEYFEEHVKYHKKLFRVVSLEELNPYLSGAKQINEKLAHITFDEQRYQIQLSMQRLQESLEVEVSSFA